MNIGDRIFVAGSNGMVGSAICRALIRNGYCNKLYGGKLLTRTRSELNLLDIKEVEEWFR